MFKTSKKGIGMNYNKLTPEEEMVIVEKATEARFAGDYDNFYEMEYLFVGNVMPLIIRLNVSLMLAMDGQVSMITSQKQ